MDGEHVFSAAIVLVMVCVALPTNPANTAAMNAGLDLLRAMAERGNSHIAARYELLAHLRAAATNNTAGMDARPPNQPPMPPPFPADNNNNTGDVFLPPLPDTLGQAMFPPPSVAAGLAAAIGGPMPSSLTLSIADPGALQGVFYNNNEDEDTTAAAGDAGDGLGVGSSADLGLWEEGFADPAVMDAGSDLTQWTRAAQMVVDHGMGL